MNRLRDEVGDDPVAERGITLLRSYAATPVDGEMKRRVLAAIQQTRLRAVAPQPFGRLRWVAACVVVLGLAGTAGAMITQRWILPERDRAVESARERRETTQRAAHKARAAADGATATAAGSSVASGDAHLPDGAIASEGPLPAERVRTAPRRAAPLANSRTRAVSRAAVTGAGADRATVDRTVLGTSAGDTPPEATTAVRERTQVLDALIALRRDHDGARAGMLLDGYLAGFPHGVLREEALVLAIEAADARGDGANARRLARSYETAYPGGRFSAFARRRAAAASP